MEMFIKANLRMVIDKAREVTLGRIKVITRANGWQTKWMVKVFTQILKFNFKVTSRMITLSDPCIDIFLNYTRKPCWIWLLSFYLSLLDSVWEVEEVVCSIIISSHTPTPDSVRNQEWEPCNSPESSIEVLYPPTLDNIFSEASIHIVEVEMLINRRSWMNYSTLNYIQITL